MSNFILKEHMRSHTGENNWIIFQWCGQKYGYRRSWKKHVLEKHKDKEGLPETRKIEVVERISRKGARPGDCFIAKV